MNAPPGQDASSPINGDASPPAMEPNQSSVTGAGKDLSAHHRILALNKVWEERRVREASQRRVGIDSEDSSSTDTDSSADIVSVPRPQPGAQPSVSTPLPSTALKRSAGPRISETPVPLPDFVHQGTAAKPPVSSSTPTATPIASNKLPPSASQSRAQTSRSTAESALKQLELVEEKARTSRDTHDPTEMRFATPGELLARIRQDSANSQPSPAPEAPDATQATTEVGAAMEMSPSAYSDNGDDDDDDEDDETSSEEVSILDSRPEFPHGDEPVLPTNTFQHALDGRPYWVLRGPDGSTETSRGVVVPTNYELHPQPPHYICPVRDCRRLMKTMSSLGGHFSAKHCCKTFNDNLDGTLSFVSEYKKIGSRTCPGVVVSQNPLPPNAPPPVEPGLPFWKNLSQKQPSVEASTSSSGQSPTVEMGSAAQLNEGLQPDAVPTIVSDIAPLPDAHRNACEYLQTLLSSRQPVPSRADIRAMIHLPMRRELPTIWINHHGGKTLEAPMFAAALAYTVGDEVTGPGACAKKYLQAGRLSLKCVALPSSLSDRERQAFYKLTTCVGCFYRSYQQRQRNVCDWTDEGRADNTPEGSGEIPLPVFTTAASATLPPAVSASKVTTKEESRDSEREDSSAESSRIRTLASTRVPRKRAAPADPELPMRADKALKLSDPADRPEAISEMEPWEIAPGRIADEANGESLAFSCAYMMSTKPLQVLPDIGLNALAIGPGESVRWAAESKMVRSCMVASGKIRVTTKGKSFLLGPHGSFLVAPGQACVMENRIYFQAIVHCWTLKDYDLVD
ncbi:hypothetical protein HIM_06603 [Hirsutella minnesotensis 3608]|uniref:C2H2-type domain-containing protein n=1 Tax=Hirsutella minnesotensis 3608 TaxID=1043627 RepID=A0A0F7ZNL0_9HYPO|nr:hypothetical protein HIM_06603 [Hirsutella minnesotensis 3608]